MLIKSVEMSTVVQTFDFAIGFPKIVAIGRIILSTWFQSKSDDVPHLGKSTNSATHSTIDYRRVLSLSICSHVWSCDRPIVFTSTRRKRREEEEFDINYAIIHGSESAGQVKEEFAFNLAVPNGCVLKTFSLS